MRRIRQVLVRLKKLQNAPGSRLERPENVFGISMGERLP